MPRTFNVVPYIYYQLHDVVRPVWHRAVSCHIGADNAEDVVHARCVDKSKGLVVYMNKLYICLSVFYCMQLGYVYVSKNVMTRGKPW